MKEPIIETKELTKTYGDAVVVNRVSLSVAEGDVFGFLGHNGAGKTTTVNMLTTLLSASSGTARIAGFDLGKESFAIKKIIGYVPENVELYGSLSAYENLEYFARLSGVKNPKQVIDETAEFLGIENYLHKRIGILSKGMRPPIGASPSLLPSPPLFFLDEPTSGLDPIGVKQLREIIHRLNVEKGMTIFMNTHLLSEVAHTCKTIGILNHGKLTYRGSLLEATNLFKNEEALEAVYIEHQA